MRIAKWCFSLATVIFTCLSIEGSSLEQEVSLEGNGTRYNKKNSWTEASLLYNVTKNLAEPNAALLGAIGTRSDTLNLNQHLHPSTYNSLIALIGAKKQYGRWQCLSTLEGVFQAPTFNPIKTTRYTGEVLWSYQFSNNFSAQFGAGVRFGLHSPIGYPILGLIYLKDKWTLEFLLPELATIAYQVNKKDTVRLYFIHKPRVFQANHAYGHEKAIINFQTIFAETRWTHSLSKKTSLWIGLGWNLFTRVKAGNRVYDHEKTVFHSSKGLMATLGIKKDF